jgi:hypothetical protein
MKGTVLRGLLRLARHPVTSSHRRTDVSSRFQAHVVENDICYTLFRSTDTTTSFNLAQSRLCMEQASDDQAEYPTTIPQTLQHLATRTHLPF